MDYSVYSFKVYIYNYARTEYKDLEGYPEYI